MRALPQVCSGQRDEVEPVRHRAVHAHDHVRSTGWGDADETAAMPLGQDKGEIDARIAARRAVEMDNDGLVAHEAALPLLGKCGAPSRRSALTTTTAELAAMPSPAAQGGSQPTSATGTHTAL